MTITRRESGIQVRPFEGRDEPRVLELLSVVLGGGPAGRRPPEFFRWKHLENPFGPSFMLVAEADGRIVGLRAFMRWRFRCGGRSLSAVRAVDTATHPDYQRLGIFSRLTRAALDALHGEVDFVFNTPNERSLPGYLKLGWREVGKLPVAVRVRRPVRFARRLLSREAVAPEGGAPPSSAPAAGEILRDAAVFRSLGEARPAGERLATPRDAGYLRWRYGSAPFLDYRAIRLEEEGRVLGMAIFRVRPRGRLWETTVSELLAPPEDRRTRARLLREVVRAAHVDHVTCHFTRDWSSTRSAWRSGFLPSPVRPTLVVRPLRDDLEPDPLDARSWALSLGDIEVF